MEKGDKKKIMEFIFAYIAAALCIAILIAGVVMVRKKDELEEEFDEEWMDYEKWKQSR